ncbi:YihY/virulence factor BrkB family protein [Candidatus Anaplasma sp. TIGMIC]|uniref:YihY/virulence factor BrkB family protein n=1 Tax=Candidatus Anaplasma sp. TIGMIC TaxID=3020713 RepID=UPI00232D8737|nr:YihY/virulence factor BrkB family protein [Candidatus Anaplasma sp. TIGMIC]MDB1135635.1 YihY/virulence factor BrkB family protein [Candidatus Anaplasma sp. TIGMIC]
MAFFQHMLTRASRGVVLFFYCARKAIIDFRDHAGMEYAGYLSFMVLLSLFPFLVFFNALTSSILSVMDKDSVLYDKLFDFLSWELPYDTMAALLPRIEEILSGPPQSLLTLAIVGVVWTASSVIEGIRNVLNRALRVSAPPPYILGRMFSILQFLVIVVFMMLSTLCITLLPIIFEMVDVHWAILRFALIKLMLFLSIAWIYFIVPNLKQEILVVVPGAVIVTILWSLSSTMFSWYLSTFHVLDTIYGNLTGVIAALLFFYILSIFFIYGAELNYRLSHIHHS